MKLDNAIKNRKSVRNFNNKKPDWRHIVEAIDSMRYAPKAGNNFSLRTIIIDDEKKIERIAEASQQDFIKEVKHLVVVCGDVDRMENLYPERGKKYLKQQAGAAIQNFLLSLEERGLATCWVGHFTEEKVKHLLEIPEKMEVEAIFPIGYEKKVGKEKEKTNPELSSYLFFNKYGDKKMNSPRKLSE
ncbi:MAG TPA: nitroreductase family protein [Candidatus Nanoarchaeia archaeon]|nr:nitroreductase family protein [Candidatus Nanoarchaeia archaeon]